MLIYRVKFLTFIFLISIFLTSLANIKEIDSLEQAEKDLSEIDIASTLIVFDIHGVLITPDEVMHNLAWQNPEYFDQPDFVRQLQADFKCLCLEKKDPAYVDRLLSIVWQKSRIVPIEDNTVKFIQNLLKRGCKMVAITRCDVSPWGKFMPNIREWNYLKLFENGIDFSRNFNQLDTILETIFYKGILFAGDNAENKGCILGEFLDAISGEWKPSKIICFDDKNDNLYLDSFDKEMEKRGISSMCFWYKALCNKIMRFDRDIVKFQYDYLLQNKDYIDEDGARKRILKDGCESRSLCLTNSIFMNF